MPKLASILFALVSCCVASLVLAQEKPVQTSGTVVVIPASGEIRLPNDQAVATFMVEEQDKEKSAAASRANLKMKQGIDILKKEDPQSSLRTRGYYSYPIYADDAAPRQPSKTRSPVGWRVGQYLELTTTNIEALPRTVASAQRLLALNGLHFGLSDVKVRQLEEQRVAVAYQNLLVRIQAISKAMGRNPGDAVLDTLDFEGSGNYVQQEAQASPKVMRAAIADAQMEEPSFEPGETVLSTRIVAKVRFK